MNSPSPIATRHKDNPSSLSIPSRESTETLASTSVKKSPSATICEDEAGSPIESPFSNQTKVGEKAARRGRKGHTKSRSGCLNCKRARIKCKENRPSCDYCAHRNLRCQWPALHITQSHNPPTIAKVPVVNVETLPSPVKSISTTGPVFTMLDFRLFNHFIQTAYPHHPMGNDSKWTHEIPCISSNFDYLLHSMLALSASDIACRTDDKALTVTAVTHRVKSVEALNAAVGRGITCAEQGNAMLATCFALLFQSTLLNDGLGEYMSFIRGCIAIGIQMGRKGFNFVFTGLWGDDQLKLLDPALERAPLLESQLVSSACRSLEKMAPLCKTKVELDVLGLMLGMARNLVTSSRDAFMSLRKVYELFSFHMPYDEFRELTDPKNEVCQLLQAHFVSMQLIMTPITKNEWAGRDNSTSGNEDGKTGHWLKTIHQNIPKRLESYYEWTLWVQREVYESGRLNQKC